MERAGNSPHVPQVACLRHQFVLARICVDTEDAGHHVLDAQPPLSWTHDTTSRMSWLSGTTPLTEHINYSICCSSSRYSSARHCQMLAHRISAEAKLQADLDVGTALGVELLSTTEIVIGEAALAARWLCDLAAGDTDSGL